MEWEKVTLHEVGQKTDSGGLFIFEYKRAKQGNRYKEMKTNPCPQTAELR